MTTQADTQDVFPGWLCWLLRISVLELVVGAWNREIDETEKVVDGVCLSRWFACR